MSEFRPIGRPIDKRKALFGQYGLEQSELGLMNYKADNSPEARRRKEIHHEAEMSRSRRKQQKLARELASANEDLLRKRVSEQKDS